MRRTSGSASLTRRGVLSTLTAGSLLFAIPRASAQSATDVNRIIKDLAPIRGQTNSGGYSPEKREPVVIEDRTIYIDVTRQINLEVYFDFDSDAITPRACAQLADLGAALASPELQAYRYLIAGHTDAVGADDYNLDLSRRRASTVAAYLMSAFPIDPRRLVVIGYGFRRLKLPSAPQAAVNRRVEVSLIVS